MLVIDNILIAIVAVIGLNLVTGFAGLISIGHAAFVGSGPTPWPLLPGCWGTTMCLSPTPGR
jgi:hypothetical protein